MSLLGADLGTTGGKAAVFSDDGRCLAQAYREYDILHPQPGWAELDSQEVWRKTKDIIREVAAKAKDDPVTAICFSSMGEAMVPVTRKRQILGNSILSLDSRGAEYVKRLENEFGQEAFYKINPNTLGPQYSLPKLLWLKEHRRELFEQTELFLLWSDFAAFMLGAEPVTNNSLANRTMLFDLEKNDWSHVLLRWSGLPKEKFARVVPGGTVIGEVSASAARETGLPAGAKIVSGGHDQCCNALGCGSVKPGGAVCGLGTYECITPVYEKVKEPLELLHQGLNMEHHVLPGLYVSFIYNLGGALVKWFRDTFASHETAQNSTDIYDRLCAEMPAAPTRLLVLPHFETPYCPSHIPDTAGVILGLKTSTTRGEILKAILEGETMYFVASIQALKNLGIDTAQFIAGGGGARSDYWLQIKADIFGVPFIRPRMAEGGLCGAAMLAGLATGTYDSPRQAAEIFVKPDKTFLPDWPRHKIYREKFELYEQLYPANQNILQNLSRGRNADESV